MRTNWQLDNLLSTIYRLAQFLVYIVFFRATLFFVSVLLHKACIEISIGLILLASFYSFILFIIIYWKQVWFDHYLSRWLVLGLFDYAGMVYLGLHLLSLDSSIEKVFCLSFNVCIFTIMAFFVILRSETFFKASSFNSQSFINTECDEYRKWCTFWEVNYPKGKMTKLSSFQKFFHFFLFAFSSFFTLELFVFKIFGRLLKLVLVSQLILYGAWWYFAIYISCVLILTMLYSLKPIQTYFKSIYGEDCFRNLGWNVLTKSAVQLGLEAAVVSGGTLFAAGVGVVAADAYTDYRNLTAVDRDIAITAAQERGRQKIAKEFGPEVANKMVFSGPRESVISTIVPKVGVEVSLSGSSPSTKEDLLVAELQEKLRNPSIESTDSRFGPLIKAPLSAEEYAEYQQYKLDKESQNPPVDVVKDPGVATPPKTKP